MFKIYDDSIIYVVCPADKKTGGTELAHQLVKEMTDNGVNAYITYYYWDQFENPINGAFREYVSEFKKVEEIEDNSHNILIAPEIKYDMINKYSNIQKSIWWMSVDNYVKNDSFLGLCKVNGFVKGIKGLIKGSVSLREKGFDKTAVHFYQSEYAKQFLKKKGVEVSYRLSDYVNDSYLETVDLGERENNVLYNPKKGIKFTSKLKAASPELNWVPIQNMTTGQVKDLLSKSKVYIDFGNHPGKDRFPREAAISGCCVITGKNGSAKYYNDIPISDAFKYDAVDANIPDIINSIKNCLNDYDNISKEFEDYRNMIRNEHKVFGEDVCEIIRNSKVNL